MKLTLADVEHVAKLARLRLNDEEKEKSVTHLSAIIEAIDVLALMPKSAVKRSLSTNDSALREDVVSLMLTREKVVANAPQWVDDSFAIPRVIE